MRSIWGDVGVGVLALLGACSEPGQNGTDAADAGSRAKVAADSGKKQKATTVAANAAADLPCPPLLPNSAITPPSVNGKVTTSVADGQGGAFFAGSFSAIAGTAVQGLAHVLADGTVDTNLRHGVDRHCGNGWDGSPQCFEAEIRAMVVTHGTLVVGGGFTSIAGAERRYLAAFDVGTGALLPWSDGRRATEEEKSQRISCTFGSTWGVYALATDGERVFVGGCEFKALDPVTGAPSPGFEPPMMAEAYGSEDPVVDQLALIGNELWVKGPLAWWLPDSPGDRMNGTLKLRRQGSALDRRTGELLDNCAP